MNLMIDGFAVVQCLLQRIEHEARMRRAADPPADDAAGDEASDLADEDGSTGGTE